MKRSDTSTGPARVLTCALILAAALFASACNDEGIGMGVPSSGSRWGGGGSSGPGIIVGGGPVYR